MTRKQILRALSVPAMTLILLGALLRIDPFSLANGVLLHLFGKVSIDARGRLAQPDNVYQDPQTQEVSRGNNPLASFETLANFWAEHPEGKRVYFVGNSQMLILTLAPLEPSTSVPERTYPDLVFAHYRNNLSVSARFYRLAAPAISYAEVLLYLRHLIHAPELRPDEIILQVDYQSFRQVGIRDGMLELLSNAPLRSEVESIARSQAPYAIDFQDALSRYEETNAKRGSNPRGRGDAATSETGILKSFGFGNLLEAKLRKKLDGVPGWQDRHHQMHSDFLNFFYYLRVFILRIRPSTPRPSSGIALRVNRSALEEIARSCRQSGIELSLMNAPQNPAAPLYSSDQERRMYQKMIRGIAQKYGLRLYDFEHAIPGPEWGVWIDGPDPIHMGRAAQTRMARLVVDSGIVDLGTTPNGTKLGISEPAERSVTRSNGALALIGH